MPDNEEKIVTPSAEEVAQYGGEAPAPDEAGGPAAEQQPSPADEWKDKYLRARAELSNYQRRVERERAEAVRYAASGFARSLLPILDNLDRVIAASEAGGGVDALLEGARLTRDMFLKALAEHGVEAIEAEDKPFDPSVHEAMMEQPSDKHTERTVLQELAKGYIMHGRVLRPARVVVSRAVDTGGE